MRIANEERLLAKAERLAAQSGRSVEEEAQRLINAGALTGKPVSKVLKKANRRMK